MRLETEISQRTAVCIWLRRQPPHMFDYHWTVLIYYTNANSEHSCIGNVGLSFR